MASTRLAGLLTGLALAAAGVVSWGITGGTGTLGADVRVTSGPTGELDVSPLGGFLSATSLQPAGAPAEGELKVRNQTGTQLSVHLRMSPSLRDLDDLLALEIDVDGDRLFAGRLVGLRQWSEHTFTVAPGQRRAIRVRTWLPADTVAGYQGRITDIGLEFQAHPVRP